MALCIHLSLAVAGSASELIMGPLTRFYMYNFRATLRPFHAEKPPREPPVIDSEATAAVLPGAKSIWTIKRLLRVWSQPPVGHLDDFLATSSTGFMRRGTPVCRPEGPEFKPLGSALHAPG